MNTNPAYMRLLRLAGGLSLDEVAQRVGVSRSVMSRVERGYARLSPEMTRRWITALAHITLPATPLAEIDVDKPEAKP